MPTPIIVKELDSDSKHLLYHFFDLPDLTDPDYEEVVGAYSDYFSPRRERYRTDQRLFIAKDKAEYEEFDMRLVEKVEAVTGKKINVPTMSHNSIWDFFAYLKEQGHYKD